VRLPALVPERTEETDSRVNFEKVKALQARVNELERLVARSPRP